jgi:hypothetical protein
VDNPAVLASTQPGRSTTLISDAAVQFEPSEPPELFGATMPVNRRT